MKNKTEEYLNNLKSLIELYGTLSKLHEQHKEDDCKEEKECDCKEENDETKCEHILSLHKDLNEFHDWAVGDFYETGALSKKQSRDLWKLMHNDLPIPRILQSEEDVDVIESTVCLFMDAYPLYLEEKKRKENLVQ